MTRLLLAGLILLALSLPGCTRDYLCSQVGDHLLVSVDCSIQGHVRHVERTRKVLADFQRRMHTALGRLTIQVDPHWIDHDNDWNTPPVRGCYYRKTRTIRLAGERGSLPSLWHELCHAAFAPRDANHEDPRWPEWERLGLKWAPVPLTLGWSR